MEERVDTSQDCDSSTADAVAWFQSVMGLEDWTIEVVDSDVAPDWAVELGLESEGQLSYMYCNRNRKSAGVWIVPALHTLTGADSLAVLFSELDGLVMCDISNADPEVLNEAEEFVSDRRGRLYAGAYRAMVMRGH